MEIKALLDLEQNISNYIYELLDSIHEAQAKTATLNAWVNSDNGNCKVTYHDCNIRLKDDFDIPEIYKTLSFDEFVNCSIENVIDNWSNVDKSNFEADPAIADLEAFKNHLLNAVKSVDEKIKSINAT